MPENSKAVPMVDTLDLECMLEHVRCYILNSIDTRNRFLREMALYFADNQGKLLRPTLTLACGLIGESSGINMDELYQAAAGVEILHMSALVHDDILDRAAIRRGKPSVNAVYGESMALLLGDYFYSRALNLMGGLSASCILTQALKVIARMVEGEVKQQKQAFDFTTSIKDYLKVITYKTAYLTSFSCYAGAQTANLSKNQTRLLVKIGYDFGKAYQVRDDILDFLGDEARLKKPSSDLVQGTITLPMIFLLKMIKELKGIPGERLKEYVSDEIDSTLKINAARKAAQYCNRWISQSIKNLDIFPTGYIKQKLITILEKMQLYA